MKNISKSFSFVKVLKEVDFSVKHGTVHALMGENGAGKSTLMKILAGVYDKDDGEIVIDGNEVTIDSPITSQQLGVSMIHQELSSLPEMTVAENIYLSREPGKSGFLDSAKMYKDAEKLLNTLNVNIDPKEKVKNLKVADQQMVEIAKAISLNANIIIMDEPTSAISDREVEILFETIRNLKKSGKSIIYISHKMDEIFKICDYITVLRDGALVGSWPISELDHDKLVKHMVGRELDQMYPKVKVPIGETILEVCNITSKENFYDISFDVKEGEILAVAGLVGAGRSELMDALFGLRPIDEGNVIFNGKEINIKSPRSAMDTGVAYVTEDRKKEGLIMEMDVGKNISLSNLNLFGKGFINQKREREVVDQQIEAFNIKVSSRRQLVKSLSGGNQQKVVLAKWLTRNPKVLILDEPTRGIDVGAKSEIYKLMCDYVAQGNSIIMVSSEMPEVLGMADRIIVLSNKRMGGELLSEDFTQENIMTLAVKNL